MQFFAHVPFLNKRIKTFAGYMLLFMSFISSFTLAYLFLWWIIRIACPCFGRSFILIVLAHGIMLKLLKQSWIKSNLKKRLCTVYSYVFWNFILNKFYFTAQKVKFHIKDLVSKCDQIPSFLRVWSHLLKKSLMENFIFLCSVCCMKEIIFQVITPKNFIVVFRFILKLFIFIHYTKNKVFL